MSGGGGGPIIIWTLTISKPSYLPSATVARLREIAQRVNTTNTITFAEKFFVARAVFVYLTNTAIYYP